jgi:hypothetical protein
MLTIHTAGKHLATRKFSLTRALSASGVAALVLAGSTFVYAQTSPLTVQPSTGRIGVGTTSPNSALEVKGTNVGVSVMNNAGSMNYHLGIKDDDSNKLYIGRGKDPSQGVAPVITVTTADRVGIGTTNPVDKFHVYGGHFFLADRGDNCCAGFVMNSNGKETHLYNLASDGRFMIHKYGAGSANGEVFSLLVNGNLGIGISAPTSALHVNGTFTASGNKSFRIDHPLDRDNKDLVHAALEGPEGAVYYRGEASLVNGEAVIGLPAYFEALTQKKDRTVQLTPVGGWSPLYVAGAIDNNRFTVKMAAGGSPMQGFYWEVKAVRADLPDLEIEPRKKKPGDKDFNLPTVDRTRNPGLITSESVTRRQ